MSKIEDLSKFPREKPVSLNSIHSDKDIEIPSPVLKKAPNEKVLDDYLSSVYNDVKKPGSFLGVEKLYDAVKAERVYNVTVEEITKWLQKHEPYSLNRAVRRVSYRNAVLVSGIDDQFEADLADLSNASYVEANNGVKYLLVVIDVFSRFLWVEALVNKQAKTIIAAFEKIFKSSKRKPKRLRTDRGSEFTAKTVQNFMKSQKIHQMFTSNEVQANYAERVIKTLKSKIYRYVVHENTFQYTKVLQDMVDSYNNTWHHGIRERPKNVNKSNEGRLWWQMYWPDTAFLRELKRKRKYKFEIGDKVRMTLRRQAFQKEYDLRWTGEIFIIVKRFKRDGTTPLYKLNDYENAPVSGSFYENELQKVNVTNDTLFVVEEILERKTVKRVPYIKVKYRHWPDKFNRWIKKSELVVLKKKKLTKNQKKHGRK